MPETGQSVENRSPLVSGDSDHPTPKRWARDYPAGYRMGQNPREHATQRLPGPVSGRRKRSERAPGTRRSRTSGRFVSGSLKHRSSDHPASSIAGPVAKATGPLVFRERRRETSAAFSRFGQRSARVGDWGGAGDRPCVRPPGVDARAHKFGLAASSRIAVMSVQTNGDSSAQRLHAGRDCSVDH